MKLIFTYYVVDDFVSILLKSKSKVAKKNNTYNNKKNTSFDRLNV